MLFYIDMKIVKVPRYVSQPQSISENIDVPLLKSLWCLVIVLQPLLPLLYTVLLVFDAMIREEYFYSPFLTQRMFIEYVSLIRRTNQEGCLPSFVQRDINNNHQIQSHHASMLQWNVEEYA